MKISDVELTIFHYVFTLRQGELSSQLATQRKMLFRASEIHPDWKKCKFSVEKILATPGVRAMQSVFRQAQERA
jgi:hypothetical protein